MIPVLCSSFNQSQYRSANSTVVLRCDFIGYKIQQKVRTVRRKEYKCAKSKYKQFSYLSAHWRTTVRRKFRLSAFNKSKYSSADNIANLYCHWLKYLQKDEIYVVLLSCAGKRERNQMPWYRLIKLPYGKSEVGT